MKDMIKDKQKLILIIAICAAAIVFITTTVVLIVKNAGKSEPKKEPRIISISIDAPDDIPLFEKESIVYESLIKAGYSPAGACGIMGNIAVESPDFDPAAVNPTSGALGLFQWNDVGDRQQHLKDFCRENKMNWNSFESQLAFAVYELSGADPIACRLDDFLKETEDTYSAAAEFAAGFERCISDSGKAADVYKGALYPEFYGQHYQGLSKRINKAMNYHIRFVESDDNEEPSVNITIE